MDAYKNCMTPLQVVTVLGYDDIMLYLIGNGVKPALEGAEDANGGQYSAQMEQLMASGIRIFACEATLNYYNLTEDDLAFGVETVPSGVAALGRLQAREGWGYIKL